MTYEILAGNVDVSVIIIITQPIIGRGHYTYYTLYVSVGTQDRFEKHKTSWREKSASVILVSTRSSSGS